MCPVVLLALLFSFLMLLMEVSAGITVAFSTPMESWTKFMEGEERTVYFTLNNATEAHNKSENLYKVLTEEPYIADVVNQTFQKNEEDGSLNGTFVIRGNFLGMTKLLIVKERQKKPIASYDVKITKVKQAITRAFTICVAVLVSLNYINMGCAMDLNVVASVLKKPIAPAVGFFSQYVIMPLVAYGLARALFTDLFMQLGLFTFGCSPGGGASNMWTVLLKGNLNLSLTMTLISGLAALGMMPLWLFTLGRTLFAGIKTAVPYREILITLFTMVVTLGIGLSFQKYLPRVAKCCRRILAPVSIAMILFIIVFGTYAYLYMFQLFTWRVVVAATTNVWLGFLFGALTSKLFHLPIEDIIAITVETGVQNTGIAFVLLHFSLPEPEKDLAAVVPVAASIMTPIPLLLLYGVQKFRSRFFGKSRSQPIYGLAEDEERRALPLPTPSSAESISGSKTNGYVY